LYISGIVCNIKTKLVNKTCEFDSFENGVV